VSFHVDLFNKNDATGYPGNEGKEEEIKIINFSLTGPTTIIRRRGTFNLLDSRKRTQNEGLRISRRGKGNTLNSEASNKRWKGDCSKWREKNESKQVVMFISARIISIKLRRENQAIRHPEEGWLARLYRTKEGHPESMGGIPHVGFLEPKGKAQRKKPISRHGGVPSKGGKRNLRGPWKRTSAHFRSFSGRESRGVLIFRWPISWAPVKEKITKTE